MSRVEIEALGVTVAITRSGGLDGAPVVFVDTDDTVAENARGPEIRVRLNDEPIYVGKPYEPSPE